MSFQPVLWAMQSAPVIDAAEWAILVAMAEAAEEDGCNSYRSRKTIGKMVRLDPKTVGRRQLAMEKRGILARGDQSVARHIPADVRPVVWDLMIPYQWFPDIATTNMQRAARGCGPLAPECRPPLGPAPARKARADMGVPCPQRSKKKPPQGMSPKHEGTTSPTLDEGTTSPAVSSGPSTRGLEDPDPVSSSPTTLSSTHPTNPVPNGELPLSGAEAPPDSSKEPSAGFPAGEPETAQTILADYIDWARTNGPVARSVIGHLAKMIDQLLGDGFTPRVIKLALAEWHGRGEHPSTLPSRAQAIAHGTNDRRARSADPAMDVLRRDLARVS